MTEIQNLKYMNENAYTTSFLFCTCGAKLHFFKFVLYAPLSASFFVSLVYLKLLYFDILALHFASCSSIWRCQKKNFFLCYFMPFYFLINSCLLKEASVNSLGFYLPTIMFTYI